MKNILKGLSESKLAEITELANQIYDIGFADGQASTVEDAAVEQPIYQTEKRVADIGESILITKSHTTDGEYENGDVLEVVEVRNSGLSAKGIEIGILHFEYEVIVNEPTVLTANQQRAILNQQAKKFVEQTIYERRELVGLSGDEISYDYRFWDLDFIVNAEKRTVVVLLKDRHTKRVRFRGIAKCMPGDVFHADIGKAIALARALQIDIPQEFLNAVQPDEVLVGMVVVKHSNANVGIHQTIERLDGISHYSGVPEVRFWTKECFGSLVKSQINIIDDTNAEYGNGE